ncbi:MAG: group II intron maturase-specific domain-containing protein [Euzebya sp.]
MSRSLRPTSLTRRARCHADIREVIRDLNWMLRGRGNFRTGNSAVKFVQLDRHVVWRLTRLLVKRYGRNLQWSSTLGPRLL